MKRSVFPLSLVGLGAGLVAGFFLGLLNRSSEGDPAVSLAAQQSGLIPTAEARSKADDWSAPDAGPPLAAPEAMRLLGRLQSTEDLLARSDRLDELCAALDAAGARALLGALLERRLTSAFDEEIVQRLAARWAEIDPHAAADYAADISSRERFGFVYEVLWVWARSDPAAARAWALDASGRDGRRYGLNAIIQIVAESDPRAALKFIDDLPPAEDRLFYYFGVFDDLARKNPSLATELALETNPGPARRAAMHRVATVWGEAAPEKALAWYVQNTSPYDRKDGQGEVMADLVKAWVKKAPDDVLAFAADQRPGDLRSDLISEVAKSWGEIDPHATAAWLFALPKSFESVRAFDRLIDSWAESDPAKAGDFLLAQPAERSRDWSLNSLGWDWADKDPEAALAWARRQSVPEVERYVVAAALGVMAAKDLAHAADYLGQLKTPETLGAAMIKVTNEIGRRDPKSAVEWAAQQPDSAASAKAVEWPIGNWAGRDADAVIAWHNEQPTGPRKDAAIGAFARRIAQNDGAGAATWANSIADEAVRARQLDEVLGRWAQVNHAAARGWVETQNFPEARQKELVKLVAGASGR